MGTSIARPQTVMGTLGATGLGCLGELPLQRLRGGERQKRSLEDREFGVLSSRTLSWDIYYHFIAK